VAFLRTLGLLVPTRPVIGGSEFCSKSFGFVAKVAIVLRKIFIKKNGDRPQEDLVPMKYKSLVILVVYFWLNTKSYGKYRNMAIF
jgi:hypothetical protein